MAMSNLYSKIAQMKRNSEPANMSFSQTHWINGEKRRAVKSSLFFFVLRPEKNLFCIIKNFMFFPIVSKQRSADVAATQQRFAESTRQHVNNAAVEHSQLTTGIASGQRTRHHILLFTFAIDIFCQHRQLGAL
jgi:hypothetical protein